tara:strand:+ start:14428 stop:14889 length:462 start_codon:yes stop_codon:yes gene_type:complete
MSNNIDTHEIMMSPLLSDRLNRMDKKLDTIIKEYNDINCKFNKILELLEDNSNKWNDNKKEYISLLVENKDVSKHNMDFLNENRELYLEELNKIQKNNSTLLNNIYNPDLDVRRNNRYWRTSGNNTVMKAPSGLGNILWPWNSPWSKSEDSSD